MESPPDSASAAATAIRQRETVELRFEGMRLPSTGEPIRYLATAPRLCGGEALGSLGMPCIGEDAQPYDEAQLSLLQTFADQAAIAIESPACSRSWDSAPTTRPRR